MKPILDWLVSIGGSPVDVLLMGIIIAGFVMQWNQKRMRNAEVKELFHKYNQLDKLIGEYSVVIQCVFGIKLTARHHSGDYSLTDPLLDNLANLLETRGYGVQKAPEE